jgi:Zn-dependent protease with chaperone function
MSTWVSKRVVSFAARYFDGRTSAARDVEISLYADGRVTVNSGDELLQDATVADVQISERIGDTARRVTFADGAMCETTHNDAIDQWLERLGAHSHEHRVFRLERRWQFALLALVITVVGTWAFLRFGLPATADRAARLMPHSVEMAVGEGGMETLDSLFFEPSRLHPQRSASLQSRFHLLQRELGDSPRLRLELRHGGREIGANAFALPAGIVVVTDELVLLAQHDEEIESVMAHEVGHVVHRHSLRMVLQSSGSALLMLTLLGDVSSASTLAASVPTVLVHAKYSRDFEREADEYARAWLQRRGIASHRFGDLLQRIELEESGREAPGDDGVWSYFSSHPTTTERAGD